MSKRRKSKKDKNSRKTHSSGQPEMTFVHPPWVTYLEVLDQAEAGTAPPGADKLIAHVPFRVASPRPGPLVNLMKFADSLDGEGDELSLRESCEFMAEMAARGFLGWDAAQQHVLLTLPA